MSRIFRECKRARWRVRRSRGPERSAEKSETGVWGVGVGALQMACGTVVGPRTALAAPHIITPASATSQRELFSLKTDTMSPGLMPQAARPAGGGEATGRVQVQQSSRRKQLSTGLRMSSLLVMQRPSACTV